MKPAESSLVELVRDIVDIRGRVERHPYGMVAGAMGAGFILGGGLFSRMTEKIAGTAMRMGLMAALPRLERELARHIGRTANMTETSEQKGES